MGVRSGVFGLTTLLLACACCMWLCYCCFFFFGVGAGAKVSRVAGIVVGSWNSKEVD